MKDIEPQLEGIEKMEIYGKYRAHHEYMNDAKRRNVINFLKAKLRDQSIDSQLFFTKTLFSILIHRPKNSEKFFCFWLTHSLLMASKILRLNGTIQLEYPNYTSVPNSSFKMSRDFLEVLDRAYECCRKNRNESWILEPCEDVAGRFTGVIFGRGNSPAPGCAFAFTLEIDENMLAEPPRVHFQEDLKHPLIRNHYFCFPSVHGSCSSCRTEPLSMIMDHLVDFFFLVDQRKAYLDSFVDPDARKMVATEKDRRNYWSVISEQFGILRSP
jgi:ubiquitin-protein ligase